MRFGLCARAHLGGAQGGRRRVWSRTLEPYTHLRPDLLLAAADLISGGLAAVLRGERQEGRVLRFEARPWI